ncbi:unnamed protein product [Prorocentrum cordatum]|uniref:Uncharacterized protein n=1 Tax=Prorocentrum cordatum TaxID=2364126 RepID=A0ABN9RBI5_9DINO|nr:unnamed protein product [Polarella glacialis]
MCDRAVGSRRLAVVMRSLRLCRPHQAFVECDFQATSTDGLSWLVFVGGLWRFGDAGADALQPQHVQVFDRKTNNTWGGVSCFLARVFVAGAGATRIRQALSCPFEPAGGIPCADRAPGGGGSERPALGEVRGGGSAREERLVQLWGTSIGTPACITHEGKEYLLHSARAMYKVHSQYRLGER